MDTDQILHADMISESRHTPDRCQYRADAPVDNLIPRTTILCGQVFLQAAELTVKSPVAGMRIETTENKRKSVSPSFATTHRYQRNRYADFSYEGRP
ncbi:hypothetical protein ACIBQ1_61500 [Nonomuraea sp. NPDC050153]|uniref:hypothetical protein n=1 Tax=Nonomuraea sp. NPDC050153 TaxID=3364359 RepID=UPI0037A2974F